MKKNLNYNFESKGALTAAIPTNKSLAKSNISLEEEIMEKGWWMQSAFKPLQFTVIDWEHSHTVISYSKCLQIIIRNKFRSYLPEHMYPMNIPNVQVILQVSWKVRIILANASFSRKSSKPTQSTIITDSSSVLYALLYHRNSSHNSRKPLWIYFWT